MTRSTIAVLLAFCLSVLGTADDRCPDGQDCHGRGLERRPRRRKAMNGLPESESLSTPPIKLDTSPRYRRARRSDHPTFPNMNDVVGVSESLHVPLRRTQRRGKPRDVRDLTATSSDKAEPRNLQAFEQPNFEYFDAIIPNEEDLLGPWTDEITDAAIHGTSRTARHPLADDFEFISSPFPAPREFYRITESTDPATFGAPLVVTHPPGTSSISGQRTYTSATTLSPIPSPTPPTLWATPATTSSAQPATMLVAESTTDSHTTFSSTPFTEWQTTSSSSDSFTPYTSSESTHLDVLSSTSTSGVSSLEWSLMPESTTSSTELETDYFLSSTQWDHYDTSSVSAKTDTLSFADTSTSLEFTSTSTADTSSSYTSSEWSSSLATLSSSSESTSLTEWSSSWTSTTDWTSSGAVASSSTYQISSSMTESSTESLPSSSGAMTTSEMTSTSSDLASKSLTDFSSSLEQTSSSTATPQTEWETEWSSSSSTYATSTSLEGSTTDGLTSTTFQSSIVESTADGTTSTESSSTDRAFLDITDYYGDSTTTSGIELTEKAEIVASPLDFIPFKSMTHLTPLEALVEEPDLSMLGGAIKANEKYPVLKKVGMTIFAPIDRAFAKLPIDMRALQNPAALMRKKSGKDANYEVGAAQRVMRQQMRPRSPRRLLSPLTNQRPEYSDGPCDPYDGDACVGKKYPVGGLVDLIPPAYEQAHAEAKLLAAKNVMDDFERLIMFHVVKRIVPPGMIEAKKTLLLRTEMKGNNLDVELVTKEDGERELVIGAQARVVEIVACRNGFIYKIDGPLFPAWNPGAPNLLQAIRSDPRFSRLRFLMDKSGMFDSWALAGPVTMLLIPDNAWRIDGLQVPPCFFKALVRPENAETLSKLLRWTTIPGLWTRKDIEASEWLPNGAAPSLSVTTIDMSLWEASQQQRKEAYDNRHNLFDPELKWGVSVEEPKAPEKPLDYVSDRVTLIEGKEVTEWDLQFYNGLGHTVAELPLRPDLDLRGMLWDCMDMFCHECPIVTKFLLKYLDGGGLLPDVTNPKAYIVPPGIRPDWMCHGTNNWFPPGWEPQDWYRYLDVAKNGNSKLAHQLALNGWRNAAGNNEVLEDKLFEAEVHLRQIWRHYANPSDFMLGVKEDPNLLIGWLRNKRSLEYKPRICDPKAPKRPGVLIDTEDPWEGGEEWGHNMVSPPRENFYIAMNRDRQRRFGMEDLRYVTQWM